MKRVLLVALFILTMIITPWNVICWSIGLWRYLQRPIDDPQADFDALFLDILAAPFFLFLELLDYIKGRG